MRPVVITRESDGLHTHPQLNTCDGSQLKLFKLLLMQDNTLKVGDASDWLVLLDARAMPP